ncbi:MAG: diguanylate cyclase [Boseongicola sp.]|nr:diguanylate cyclase [Boseongicola sp.]
MSSELLTAALYGSSAFLSAFAVFAIVTRRSANRRKTAKSNSSDLSGDTLVFLIRDNAIVDANFPGQRFLTHFGAQGLDLEALSRGLHAAFDDAASLLETSSDNNEQRLLSRDGMFQAIAERTSNALRIKVQSRDSASLQAEDIHRLSAMDAELETLRETADLAPYLVWRETRDGTPIWVNRAYLEAVRDTYGDKRATEWPLPRLFPNLSLGGPTRLSIQKKAATEPNWFEIRNMPIGRDTLFTAYDANATVLAETQLHDFMQTLTKTFAQLTTGLAIFDKSRNLALFNPALTELTRLPVDFLSSRPSLVEVLDKLRETRAIPEPRDYHAWRKSIADLESAAQDGNYCETWSLAGNLTYRVTGRPHHDGAIAFLFEDISAEMSLTRQFRQEIELSQALLDNMDDATALFSPTGVLLQTNSAYRTLWNVDPDSRLTETTILEASHGWHEGTLPTPVWGDLREYALDTQDRVEWSAPVILADGRVVDCRFLPIAGGGTQIIFHIERAAESRQDEQLREAG